MTENVTVLRGRVVSVLVISDFPSSSYANFYSTKRKSVKNAPDSSSKLISYPPIFASHFLDLLLMPWYYHDTINTHICSRHIF